jgi:hypothetical protein
MIHSLAAPNGWRDETHDARGRYAEAASAFAEGHKRTPKGAKRQTICWLGMSLARDNTRNTLPSGVWQLDHDFPNPKRDQRAVRRKRSDSADPSPPQTQPLPNWAAMASLAS